MSSPPTSIKPASSSQPKAMTYGVFTLTKHGPSKDKRRIVIVRDDGLLLLEGTSPEDPNTPLYTKATLPSSSTPPELSDYFRRAELKRHIPLAKLVSLDIRSKGCTIRLGIMKEQDLVLSDAEAAYMSQFLMALDHAVRKAAVFIKGTKALNQVFEADDMKLMKPDSYVTIQDKIERRSRLKGISPGSSSGLSHGKPYSLLDWNLTMMSPPPVIDVAAASSSEVAKALQEHVVILLGHVYLHRPPELPPPQDPTERVKLRVLALSRHQLFLLMPEKGEIKFKGPLFALTKIETIPANKKLQGGGGTTTSSGDSSSLPTVEESSGPTGGAKTSSGDSIDAILDQEKMILHLDDPQVPHFILSFKRSISADPISDVSNSVKTVAASIASLFERQGYPLPIVEIARGDNLSRQSTNSNPGVLAPAPALPPPSATVTTSPSTPTQQQQQQQQEQQQQEQPQTQSPVASTPTKQQQEEQQQQQQQQRVASSTSPTANVAPLSVSTVQQEQNQQQTVGTSSSSSTTFTSPTSTAVQNNNNNNTAPQNQQQQQPTQQNQEPVSPNAASTSTLAPETNSSTSSSSPPSVSASSSSAVTSSPSMSNFGPAPQGLSLEPTLWLKNLPQADKERIKKRIKLLYENHYREGLNTFEALAHKAVTLYEKSERECFVLMCQKYKVNEELEEQQARAAGLFPTSSSSSSSTTTAAPSVAVASPALASQQQQQQQQATPPSPNKTEAVPLAATAANSNNNNNNNNSSGSFQAVPSVSTFGPTPEEMSKDPNLWLMNLPQTEKERVKKRIKLLYEKYYPAGLATYEALATKAVTTYQKSEREVFFLMCQKYNVDEKSEQTNAQAAGLTPAASASSSSSSSGTYASPSLKSPERASQQQQQSQAAPSTPRNQTATTSSSSSPLPQQQQQQQQQQQNVNNNNSSSNSNNTLRPTSSAVQDDFGPMMKTENNFQGSPSSSSQQLSPSASQLVSSPSGGAALGPDETRGDFVGQDAVTPRTGADASRMQQRIAAPFPTSNAIPDFRKVTADLKEYDNPAVLLCRKVLRLTSKLNWETRIAVITPVQLILCGKDKSVRRSIPIADITDCMVTLHWQGVAVTLLVKNQHDCILRMHEETTKGFEMVHIAGLLCELNPEIKTKKEHNTEKGKLREVVSKGRNLQKGGDFIPPAQEIKKIKSGELSPIRSPRPQVPGSPTSAQQQGASAQSEEVVAVKNLPPQEKERFKKRVHLFYQSFFPKGLENFEQNIGATMSTLELPEKQAIATMCAKYQADPVKEETQARERNLLPPPRSPRPSTPPPATAAELQKSLSAAGGGGSTAQIQPLVVSGVPVKDLHPNEKARLKARVKLLYENHHKAGLSNFATVIEDVCATATYSEEILFLKMYEKYGVKKDVEEYQARTAGVMAPPPSQQKSLQSAPSATSAASSPSASPVARADSITNEVNSWMGSPANSPRHLQTAEAATRNSSTVLNRRMEKPILFSEVFRLSSEQSNRPVACRAIIFDANRQPHASQSPLSIPCGVSTTVAFSLTSPVPLVATKSAAGISDSNTITATLLLQEETEDNLRITLLASSLGVLVDMPLAFFIRTFIHHIEEKSMQTLDKQNKFEWCPVSESMSAWKIKVRAQFIQE